MFLKKVFFTAILSLFVYSTLNAQAEAEADTLRGVLDEITIEATYSPITLGNAPMAFSYKVRSDEDLAARPAATMDQLSYMIPGISISNRENYALGERLTIRGLGWRTPFGVRGVQVILDGLPLTEADGQTIMNMIDPAMVKRVELLRGPSATFWGNSSGGVLYLSTIPERGESKIQYRGYGGSFQTLKQELRWNFTSGESQYYGYATYFDTDGFRDHSEARLFRMNIGSRHQLSDRSSLRLIGSYTSMPESRHPGSLTSEMAEESPRTARENFENAAAGKDFEQLMWGVSFIQQFDSGVWDVTAHGTYRDLQNPLPFGIVTFDRFGGTLRSTYSFTELPFELDTGAEFRAQYDDRIRFGPGGDEIVLEQQETVLNQAFFARAAVPLTSRFTASAGLRADWLQFNADGVQLIEDSEDDFDGERSFFSLNPSVGFSYRFADSQLFANFSTSFESPTTTELVNRPGGGAGFNPDISPERTVGIETGLRGYINSINTEYDFTIYGMRVNDLLVQFQTEAGGQDFFRNEGNSNHYGIETSVTVNALQNLSLGVMVNLLRAKFDDGEFDGNDLPGIPKFRGGFNATYRIASQIISADVEFVDSYPADSENSSETDSYFLTNLRWTTTAIGLSENSSLRPFINVNNIFNTRYSTSVNINAFGGFYFEPGPDRSIQAGLQLSFN